MKEYKQFSMVFHLAVSLGELSTEEEEMLCIFKNFSVQQFQKM